MQPAEPVTVTFNITPTANGCLEHTPITASVLVNPTPVAVSTPLSQTVCSGIVNHLRSFLNLEARLLVQRIVDQDNAIAVTDRVLLPAVLVISAAPWTNTTECSVTVTFTIIPTANGCQGVPITATVLVNQHQQRLQHQHYKQYVQV